MNRPRHGRRAPRRPILVLVAALSLTVLGTQGLALVASAGTSDRDREGAFSSDTDIVSDDSGSGGSSSTVSPPPGRTETQEKVPVCHKQGPEEPNPGKYKLQNLPLPTAQGHLDHADDLIPPFTDGDNTFSQPDPWTAEAQAAFDELCGGQEPEEGGISIGKQASPGSAQPGDPITFTITVTNDGLADELVEVQDTIPAGLVLLDHDCGFDFTRPLDTRTVQDGTITCFVFVPGEGGTATVTVLVTPDGSVCGEITNTATFDVSEEVPARPTSRQVAQAGSDGATITVDCPEDLIIEKSASDSEVTPGVPFTYTITITNPNKPCENSGGEIGSPRPPIDPSCFAMPFSVFDDIPFGIEVLGVSSDAFQNQDLFCFDETVSGPLNGDGPLDPLTCSGSADPGQTITIVITVVATGSVCGDVTNTVILGGRVLPNAPAEIIDEDPQSSSATVFVQCYEIEKSASPAQIGAGDPFDWVITVTDHSAGGHFLQVTDVLPSNAVFDGVETTHGECSVQDGTLSCTFFLGGEGDDTATITVHMTHSDGCEVFNSATLDHSFFDEQSVAPPEQNGQGDGLPISDEASVSLPCGGGEPPPPPPLDLPELQLVKSGPDTAHVGDLITYSFAVSVLNGIPVEGVVVTDPLCEDPPAFTGGDTDGDGVLDPGETWTFECTHLVTDTDPDPLVNTAIASGENTDGGADTDDGSTSTDILHPAIDVEIESSDDSGAIGDEVGFRFVVTNTGDTPLFDVTLEDEEFNDFEGGASSPLRVPVQDLSPGESISFDRDLVLQLPADLTNEATATGTDVGGATVLDVDAIALTLVAAGGVDDEGGDGVAFTGTSKAVLPLASLAGILLVAGASLVAAGRRRGVRSREHGR